MSVFGSIAAFFARKRDPRIIVRKEPVMREGRAFGVAATQVPVSITRWHLSDVEQALREADTGNFQRAAQIWKACKRDGTISGVLSTRTEGLVQLPIRISGPAEHMRRELQEQFAGFAPPHELALLAADGIGCGVFVGERVIDRSGVPVVRRLDPEFLVYRWHEDRWYYRALGGLVAIEPGDGRWILGLPGGAVCPWQNATWYALGRAFIAKEHAFFLRENYAQKLANAARIAYSPQGATDEMRKGFFAKLAGWGANPVFDLPPGWEVKLLEGNGRGYEVYQETIRTCNEEITITLAGQTVTTDGGAGFQNSNIHATIRADLIQSTADALATVLNEQVIPHWANDRYGFDGIINCPSVAWDVTPPKDQQAAATSLNTLGQAITSANAALAPYGERVNARTLAVQYGVPLESLVQASASGGFRLLPDAEVNE